jgi:hypothetical protein
MPGDQPSPAERRRWPRTPVHGELVGQIYTETAAPVIDLSEGGALIEVPCVLRPRSFYTLRLALGKGAVLLLKATVVRSQVHTLEKIGQAETRVRYHAALHFIELSERERDFLRLRVEGHHSVAGTLDASLKPHDAGVAAVEPDPLLSQGWPEPIQYLPERRDAPRATLEGDVRGEVGLHLESQVLMLSPGGMTVAMPFAPQAGSSVSCSLEIDGQRVRVRAVVRDSHLEPGEGEASRYIVGLEFVELHDAERSQIANFLSRRPAS